MVMMNIIVGCIHIITMSNQSCLPPPLVRSGRNLASPTVSGMREMSSFSRETEYS